MLRFAGLLALCVVVAAGSLVAVRAAEKAPVGVGDHVTDLTFKDIRFLERSLSELGDSKAYVIAFTTLDCPIARRYLPRLGELEREYRDRGVQFVALNVGPDDPINEIAYQAIKSEVEFPVGKDFDAQVAAQLGATRTPEVVVLDAERNIRYRGRIDSQYRFGGVNPTPGRRDLKQAIDDVLAGRDVEVAETPVDGCLITGSDFQRPDFEVTFTEHVAPLLQKHCQECHRPGTTAPFSLLDYDDAVDHAEMIAEVVREKRMPPMFAAQEHSGFVNLREMTAEERDLVRAWVYSDRPLGDPSKMPTPLEFPKSKWRIGEPDLEITMAKPIELPAQGYIPYKYAILPYQFEHDTWVRGVEIMPGNRASVHHCNMAYIPGGSLGGFKDAKFITGHVPGGDAMWMDEGQGFMIPKGARLVLQLHYISIGEPTTDQTSVGFVFCDGKVDRQLHHFEVADFQFAIPPGAPHYRVVAEKTFKNDATGVGLFSHMHLRGKDMIFKAFYPDGVEETLLAVPNYNFDWQMSYRWAPDTKRFPAGTRIECVAHYDNSPFNPYNPNPADTVKYGPQTYHEMLFGFFFFTEDEEKLGLVIDGETGRVVEPAGNDAAD